MSLFEGLSDSELFPGEVPLPGKIGLPDPGVSLQKANADHGHPLLIDPWTAIPLIGGWANFGAGYRPAEMILIGNLVMLRGTMIGGPAGNSIAATLPADYTPSMTEYLIVETAVAMKLTMDNLGNLTVFNYAGVALPLTSFWWTVG